MQDRNNTTSITYTSFDATFPSRENFHRRKHSIVTIQSSDDQEYKTTALTFAGAGSKNVVRIFGSPPESKNTEASFLFAVRSSRSLPESSSNNVEFTFLNMLYPELCTEITLHFQQLHFEGKDGFVREIVPYIPGIKLSEYILSNVKSIDDFKNLMTAVLIELQRLHGKDGNGYMHGDLTEDNIIIHIDSFNQMKVYIFDFELIKKITDRLMMISIDIKYFLENLAKYLLRNSNIPQEVQLYCADIAEKDIRDILPIFNIEYDFMRAKAARNIDEKPCFHVIIDDEEKTCSCWGFFKRKPKESQSAKLLPENHERKGLF